MPPVLDLKKPGKFWAKAENEETCTFHLVVKDPKYTKANLEKNPAVDKKHQLMNPYTVQHDKADAEGKVFFDLKTRANEIGNNVKARFKKGEAIANVLGIVIVSARKGNKVPPKQLADVAEFELLGFPAIVIKPLRHYVTVRQFKAGVKTFTAELTTSGRVGRVVLTTNPKAHIRCATNGQAGTGRAEITVEPGKKYALEIQCHHQQSLQKRQMKVPPAYQTYVPGGWRTRGAKLVKQGNVWVVPDNQLHLIVQSERRYTRTDHKETWTGGNLTLSAQGTEDPNVKASAVFKAETWASGWLVGKPPAVYRHNVC